MGKMRLGGGVIARSGAVALPALLLRRSGKATRCAVSTPFPASTAFDHLTFIKDVAMAKPPEHLSSLLNILELRGESIVPPGSKRDLVPLVIPLTRTPSGNFTALLRWPTSPPGMDLPVVEVHKYGVRLLSKNVDNYIHRILAEADAGGSSEANAELWDASAETGQKLYKQGDFAESQYSDIDTYILKKVGLFPDIIEHKAACHLEKGDTVSALIAGEFYTKNHFPGFGRPFAFNANILLKVGHKLEAKDAARGSLKSPWWTLGYRYHEVAEIAEWEEEQIEYIREKVTEEGKQEDLKKGKAPEQVALDEAAFLLDLASIEGTWSDVEDRISQCYVEAGLPEIAKFITYKE